MGKASTGAPSGSRSHTATSVTKTKPYQGGIKTETKNPLKTISLKAALSGDSDLLRSNTVKKETKEEVVDVYVDPSWNEPVSQEKIKDCWLEYRNRIQGTNARLSSIMSNHMPELKNGTVLHVGLKNVTQEKELNEEKSKLFGFLKRELRNANLSLETEIVLGEGAVKKAFTAAERAKLMAEKNPSLLLLTKKFDLDVEI
ncbi:hypothetical protein [Plebeiibacterium sediminum]|uniref:DNA polymerase III subunit gamma/tau n=1 Tax=Plebeiibacterium sediminum TaxID=2992112 RepID=A0AAE3SFC5_9BACT|nr:hypothetical protein [Plebeiobacterium sediminum]MCW3786932.1 hypothetical protein [Plebeiobacterium sediminum]